MSQKETNIIPTDMPFPVEPITWRTPGRKLTKEDLSATSALILGCTTQCCKEWGTDCSRPETETA